MKNAIVLSCATGQGHNSCAEALKETFEKENIRCDITETLGFIAPWVAGAVSWAHSFMYRRIPWLFRWGYRLSEEHPGMLKPGSLMYRGLAGGADRLWEHIRAGGYDTVICTHMFSALMVTEMLERHDLPVRTAFVATDYTYCPGSDTCGAETFFVPADSLTGAFEARVKPGQRVIPSGIPVREKFWHHRDRGEAKAALRVAAGHRHLLVMCGSMGCGPLVKLLHLVTARMPEDIEVTVICGTNESLREKLSRRYRDNPRVHIMGYVEDVSLYMDSADLYLTKPGGISVTEAAAKDLPMAFVNPVSGCEEYNMDFFVGLGAAVTDTSLDRLAEKCLALLKGGTGLEDMRRALERYRQPNGAERILRELSYEDPKD